MTSCRHGGLEGIANVGSDAAVTQLLVAVTRNAVPQPSCDAVTRNALCNAVTQHGVALSPVALVRAGWCWVAQGRAQGALGSDLGARSDVAVQPAQRLNRKYLRVPCV
eukprot:2325261-Prymnesium_polylepis.1